ncbi:hypothetical protein OV450_1453 [Actinobacteria bacterium OV450]|nr:hypothetical protein OV450_1453 [Actinobacteria bacterium OV450]
MTDHHEPVRRGVPAEPQQRRPRIKGDARNDLRAKLAARYREDETASIRSLADENDLSYGMTRLLLVEADVVFRDRVRRRSPKAAQ